MGMWIVHERDYKFTYAGLRQVMDKYLVQDRSTGEIFETFTIYVYDDSLLHCLLNILKIKE